MIDFKRITLDDKRAISACLLDNRCPTCDFSFPNLYAWAPRFGTEFDVKDETLFLRFNENKSSHFYMMPVGKMPMKKRLEILLEDAASRNQPFVMKGVTCNMWDLMQEAMPNTFISQNDRDNAEYLYSAEKLATLSGKKLQKKRNHLNRFKADNPDWEYYPILTSQQIDECKAMLKVWDKITHDDEHNNYDYIATNIMLDNFNELDLKGGAIKVHGELIAFAVGSKLTPDTFVVHVEKAFGEINGAYTIINQQFAEHEGAGFKYINREEDMGIEGLRKAKLSYYPELLLEEAIVTLK